VPIGIYYILYYNIKKYIYIYSIKVLLSFGGSPEGREGPSKKHTQGKMGEFTRSKTAKIVI
jgi:hypothetical protein